MANPLYTADYAYRDVYLLAAAADEDEHAIDGARKGLEGFIACFERARFAGYVFAGGADAPGTVKEHGSMEKAREMGRQAFGFDTDFIYNNRTDCMPEHFSGQLLAYLYGYVQR